MAKEEPQATHAAGAARSARRAWLLGGLAALLVGMMAMERLAFLAHAAPTDFDDAYTYLRYAQHWLAGDGVAWNAGEPSVFGVTSLLHLALVTTIRWAFPRLAMWQVLQVVSGAVAVSLIAAVVAIAALASRHRRLRNNWILWSGLLVPVFAFREAFGFHAGTGMDTMLSALCNAVLAFSVLALAAKPTVARIGAAVSAAMLALLARPDNLICAGLCPLLAIVLLVPRPRAKPIVVYVALFAVASTSFAIAAWRLLGSPVPLSFFVKQPHYYAGFAGEFAWNPFGFLGVFFLSAWPFVVALILFADREGWRQVVVLVAPALLTVGVLFRFNQIMGHLGRFYYPLLPFFVAAAALQFDRWLRAHRFRPKAMLVRSLAAVATIVAIRAGLGLGAAGYAANADAQELPSVAGYHVAAAAPLPEVDSWESARQIAAVAAAAPTGASFAMSEHGLPGALAPHIAIIDVLGLHDPVFARRGFSAGELFRRRPDFIWLPHADHTEMLRDIIASDELWAHYDVYPDAFFHGIAIRRDGPHAGAVARLLASAWNATYPGFAMPVYRASRF